MYSYYLKNNDRSIYFKYRRIKALNVLKLLDYLNNNCVCTHQLVSSNLPRLTQPYIALHCLTSPYIALHHLTLPYIALHRLTLPYTALHSLTSPYIALHRLTSPYTALPRLTSPYTALHRLTSPYIALHRLTSPYTDPWTARGLYRCGRSTRVFRHSAARSTDSADNWAPSPPPPRIVTHHIFI